MKHSYSARIKTLKAAIDDALGQLGCVYEARGAVARTVLAVSNILHKTDGTIEDLENGIKDALYRLSADMDKADGQVSAILLNVSMILNRALEK